jgi:hypothetical protein
MNSNARPGSIVVVLVEPVGRHDACSRSVRITRSHRSGVAIHLPVALSDVYG